MSPAQDLHAASTNGFDSGQVSAAIKTAVCQEAGNLKLVPLILSTCHVGVGVHLALAVGAGVVGRSGVAGLVAAGARLLDLLHHARAQWPHHHLHAAAVARLQQQQSPRVNGRISQVSKP